MLGQLSSQIAQSLVSSRCTRLGASDVDVVFKGSQNGHKSYEQPQVVSKSRNTATAEDVTTSRYDGAVEDREISASSSLRSGRGRQDTEAAIMESQTRGQRSRRSGKRRKGKGEGDLPTEPASRFESIE